MVERSIDSPNTIQILYDSAGHILHVTGTHPPFTADGIRGLPAWHALDARDATVCQAAILRCIQSGAPETFDSHVNPIGMWRTTINHCQVGKARLIGLVRRIPGALAVLTARQREICAMLGQGLTSTDIARRIGRARETVDNHRAAIAKRIGIKPWSLVAWCGQHWEWF